MTLTEFRYVVAVARERHFGRAANSCFVSQPTLSVAIKKLEEELKVTLFERRKSDVTVTSVGKRIVEQAQRVLEESELLKQVATDGLNQLSDPLRLGTLTTIGPYLLPNLVVTIRNNRSELRLIPEENSAEALLSHLKKGELDAILISEPCSEASIEMVELYSEPLVLVLPAGHRWSQRKLVSFAELSEEDLLLPDRSHCLRNQIMAFCPTLQPKNESASLETIRHMIASNMGISILPKCAVNTGSSADHLLTTCELTEPAPSRQILLAWRKSFTRPEAITELQTVIQKSGLNAPGPKLTPTETSQQKIPVMG